MARGQRTLPYGLRMMTWEDLDQVGAIEREAFPTLWPATSYRREMRNRQAEYSVCVHQDERVFLPAAPPKRNMLDWLRRRRQEPHPGKEEPLLLGYMGQWYMAGEAHIVSIAVREDYRRQGVGELLIIGAVEMALRRDAQVLTLEVRVSNGPAIALYEKYGFKQVGMRRRYYSDNGEDAFIMSTASLQDPETTAAFDDLRADYAERYGDAPRDYL